MPTYKYEAIDDSGKSRRGVLQADSERQARSQLREQKLLPSSVQETSQSREAFSIGTRVKLADLALATRQLATLLQAAIPLEEALSAICVQTRSRPLKAALEKSRASIVEGRTLAEGLQQAPTIFDETYVSMVAAGEKSGQLDTILGRLADHVENAQGLRKDIQMAMLYPVMLTGVSLLIIGLLMAYVVPKVVSQFDHMGEALPLLTRILITISDALVAYGGWGLLLLVGLFSFFWFWLRNSENKLRWHDQQLTLPLWGHVVKQISSSRFARTLSVLHMAGVPLEDAMEASANTIGNVSLKQRVLEARDRVREGQSLYRALDDTQCFPALMVYMVASGEKSGELEMMLDKAAQNQETAFKHALDSVMEIFEPLLIIVMGGLVLAIVLAIMLPILQLNQFVSI